MRHVSMMVLNFEFELKLVSYLLKSGPSDFKYRKNQGSTIIDVQKKSFFFCFEQVPKKKLKNNLERRKIWSLNWLSVYG